MEDYEKIIEKLEMLSDITAYDRVLMANEPRVAIDPHPPGSIKLKGRNSYRVRQGDYRIIYEVIHQKLVINIIAVGHRKDIYD